MKKIMTLVCALLLLCSACGGSQNPDAGDASPLRDGFTQRTGQPAVVREDSALTDTYSYTYSDPEDALTFEWSASQGKEQPVSAGDILLVLEEADGLSRVAVPYGDVPLLYGYISSDLLSTQQADLAQGNQAVLTDCDCYAAAGGAVTHTANARVKILSRDGAWAQVEEYGTGADPYWVESADLSFDFGSTAVWDFAE